MYFGEICGDSLVIWLGFSKRESVVGGWGCMGLEVGDGWEWVKGDFCVIVGFCLY